MDCEFVARGRHDAKHKGLGKEPLPPKFTCPKHSSSELKWIKCTGGTNSMPCIIHTIGNLVKHQGTHNHPRPPEDKLPPAARQKFHKFVKQHPRVGPSNLVFGGDGRPSAADIHPSLGNRGFVKHERKKALNKESAAKPDGVRNTLGSFLQLIQDLRPFVIEVDLFTTGQQIITMQSDYMKTILHEAAGGLQSDTVEGFVYDNNWEDGQPDIHFTSAFDGQPKLVRSKWMTKLGLVCAA